MDLLNHLFTNTSYLKKLLDITASKWGLQTEETLYIPDNEYLQDGFIADKRTKTLVFRQHIFCVVKPNTCGATTIHFIHDSQEGTITCEAHKNQNLMLDYYFFSKRSQTGDEFENYINQIVNKTKE